MSKLFSRVSLTADNGSTDEYLCPGMPDTEEQITETDGYCDFIEDNPDADRRQRQRRHTSLLRLTQGSLRFGGLDNLSEIHVG